MGQLYTSMKVFHFPDKLASLAADKEEIRPPLHIRLKPTNVCNHRCRYCAYRSDDLQLGEHMAEKDFIPRAKMMEIIDDIIGMGVEAVTFSGGGEPFCYPYLAEAAQRLANGGVAFASLTNGARLQGEVAEIFAQHATWVRISMDGWDNQSYSRYRGVADGEFDRIISNIKSFKAYGGNCTLGVSLIVDQDNASQVFAFLELMRQLGVDSVKVSPCIVSNEGQENNRYHAPIFAEVKEQCRRALAELASDGFEIFDSYHALEDKFSKAYSWCPYQQILTVIGADCQVYSCQDKAYNLTSGLLGSIKEQRFADFWQQDKDKFFTINPGRDCNHHCVANQRNRLVLDYLEADPHHLGFV